MTGLTVEVGFEAGEPNMAKQVRRASASSTSRSTTSPTLQNVQSLPARTQKGTSVW